uniref:G-protein coupled receptors family 1 profile domain-containing protein n=1 Tax=Capra hircus TaxID=9925 RepID=A0A8C2NGS7_CAPHI
MDTKNATLLSMFVLTGLPYQLEWQIPLFLLFLVIYLITTVGNLGLIYLIYNDPHLHIPILAFVDSWISSTVTPKMLVNFFARSKMISLSECINGKSNEEKMRSKLTVSGESNFKRMLLAQSLSMSNKKRELALIVYDVTSQSCLYFVG